MKKFKDIILPALILTIICVVLTTALAVTNQYTKDIIAQSAAKAEQDALASCIEADNFEKMDADYGDGSKVFKAIKDEKTVGYAFSVKANGYGGNISVIVGVIDGSVSSIEITDVSNETPGLGQNAKNDSFKSKFNGVKSGDDVDAMTGATITSNAVKTAVNRALELYNEIAKEAA